MKRKKTTPRPCTLKNSNTQHLCPPPTRVFAVFAVAPPMPSQTMALEGQSLDSLPDGLIGLIDDDGFLTQEMDLIYA